MHPIQKHIPIARRTTKGWGQGGGGGATQNELTLLGVTENGWREKRNGGRGFHGYGRLVDPIHQRKPPEVIRKFAVDRRLDLYRVGPTPIGFARLTETSGKGKAQGTVAVSSGKPENVSRVCSDHLPTSTRLNDS